MWLAKSAMPRQSVLCQMPYSFSRIAGAVGRLAACSSNKRGKVVCIRSPVCPVPGPFYSGPACCVLYA